MTFQRMIGWALEVNGDRRNTRQDVIVGENGKRFTGRPMKDHRGFESRLNEEICFTAPCCADTLESLFAGMGYHFPFIENVWSARSGLGPELGSTWTLVKNDGPAASRFHSVTATGTGLVFNPKLIDFTTAPGGGRWSLVYWFKDSGTWVHKVVRSDGSGLLNGVFDAAISSAEILVDQGGLLIVAGSQIADLAILPFWLCDDAGEAFYGWASGWNMGGYWRLDRSALDLSGQLNGTLSGTPSKDAGQVKTGFRFSTDPDGVNVGGAAELSIFNFGAVTIEAMVLADSAGGTNEGSIFSKWDGSAGYRLEVIPGTASGKLGLRFIAKGTVSDLQYDAANVLTAGEFSYVCLTFDGTSPVLYVDRGDISTAWTTLTPAVTVGTPDDSAVVGMIGNRNPADTTRFFDGILNEVRVSTRVLPLDVILERYVATRNRRGVPPPQMFGDLPALPLWGEFSGWHLSNFLGTVESETFEPYSENNDRIMARRIGVSFDSVDSETGSQLPAPDFAINPTVERRVSLVSGNIRPTRGLTYWNAGGGLGAANYGVAGPFGWLNQAVSISAGAYLENSGSLGRSLFGRGAVTALAWVRRTVTGTLETVFDTSDTATPTTRLALEILANNRIALRYRPSTGDAAQTTIGDAVVEITDTDWHLIGGIADVARDTASIILDGRIVWTESIAWAAVEFSDETGTRSTLGTDVTLSNDLSGDLGAWGLWLRALSPGEILTVYEKAKIGRFR